MAFRISLVALPAVIGIAAIVVAGCGKEEEEPAFRPPPRSVRKAPPKAPTKVTISQVYKDTCSNCHGDTGEGGGAGTSTLVSKELYDGSNDRKFFDAVKSGIPNTSMPAYGDTLPDNMIWGLVVHIREMQSKGLRKKFGSPKPDAKSIYHSKLANFRLENIIQGQGLVTPWAIDWISHDRFLITNRPGTMFVFDRGKLLPVEEMPASLLLGEGGLLDVTVHPNYRSNGWIYLALAAPNSKGETMTKILRGKLSFGKHIRWTSQETIFDAPYAYTKTASHFGSRIVFDGNGHIYFSIGDRAFGDLAQKPDNPYGKIFRVNEDGSIPSDNPFVGGKGLESVWSFGHRNPEGLAFDLHGNLFDTEHGPRGGDELNLIKKGANYGWPKSMFAINYDDTPATFPWPADNDSFEAPLFRWLPSIGSCGLMLVNGPKFRKWNGDFLAGGLAGKNVDRFRIKDGKVVEHEEILQGLARVRDLAYGPDGNIYLVFNNPDAVVRLVETP